MKSRLPSRHSRSQLSELRRLLRSEAKTLLIELDRLTKAQREALLGLLKALEHSDDAKLMTDLASLRGSVEAARRALARVAIAGQSTEKLRTEWHDWECHAAFVEDAQHATKRERQEMIASELRMRGVRMPVSQVQPSVINAAPVTDAPVEAVIFAVQETMPEPQIVEDDEVHAMSEDNIAYWDALISSLPPESTDERSLARLLGAYRMVQGEQKRADQRAGKRRYRLGAFDAWS